MARELHGIELGIRLFGEDTDVGPAILFGSAAPGGDTGPQDDSEIGSIYIQQNGASSQFFQKLADTNATSDWSAFPLVLSGGFVAANGTVAIGDTFEEAIEFLAGNQVDLTTLSGVAQGAVDLGTFSGSTISDNVTIKAAFQEVETAYEETDQNVDDLITLSGVSENATNLGTFTGTTISDNVAVKVALQDLETALELKDDEPDLTGSIAQSTPTTVDTVLVDDYQSIEWMITVQDQGTLGTIKIEKLMGFHNGNSAADATIVKDDVISKKTIGSINLTAEAVLSGAAGAQTIGLQLTTSDADGINYSVRRVNVTPAL